MRSVIKKSLLFLFKLRIVLNVDEKTSIKMTSIEVR